MYSTVHIRDDVYIRPREIGPVFYDVYVHPWEFGPVLYEVCIRPWS